MNLNKPPFEDHVVDIKMPPKIRPSVGGPSSDIGLVESPMAHMWANYHSLLNDQLNTNFSDSGYLFPGQPSSTISTNLSKFGQSIVYNDSLNRMELNNGNRQNPASRAPTSEPIQTYGGFSTAQISSEAIKPENIGRIFVNSDTNELQFSVDGTTVRTITSV